MMVYFVVPIGFSIGLLYVYVVTTIQNVTPSTYYARTFGIYNFGLNLGPLIGFSVMGYFLSTLALDTVLLIGLSGMLSIAFSGFIALREIR